MQKRGQSMTQYGTLTTLACRCAQCKRENFLCVCTNLNPQLHFSRARVLFYLLSTQKINAGQTCIAVISKSKIDEEKLSSETSDDYPDLANHIGIGTLRYCHHHKPLLYSSDFAKLFFTQCHASSCGDVLGLCAD